MEVTQPKCGQWPTGHYRREMILLMLGYLRHTVLAVMPLEFLCFVFLFFRIVIFYPLAQILDDWGFNFNGIIMKTLLTLCILFISFVPYIEELDEIQCDKDCT